MTAHIKHLSTHAQPIGQNGLFRRLVLALTVRRERARLRDLDPHILNDIGHSRASARAEADRKFWDFPDHWRR